MKSTLVGLSQCVVGLSQCVVGLSQCVVGLSQCGSPTSLGIQTTSKKMDIGLSNSIARH